MIDMKYLSSFLCFFLLITTRCNTPDSYFEDALCIDNISIIDPKVGLIEHQTVIIKEGKILQVLPADQINPVSYTHLTLPTICSV